VVSVTVERLQTPRGELVLRRDGEHHEIVSNGMFLMDTRNGESERELVRAAVCGPGARVLIGGLGVGFSLAEALALGAASVTVVEIEPAVLRWNREHLGTVALDDPRVIVAIEDLADFLARDHGPGCLRARDAGPGPGAPGRRDPGPRGAGDHGGYDAICLDVDNGPEWTVTVDNAALYGEAGLSAVDRRLAPGGTVAVWSAGRAPAFEARLRRRYRDVTVTEIPVPRGEPDVVWTARNPRPAAGSAPADRPAPARTAGRAPRPSPAAPSPPTAS
jgi:spermidine synthase